MFKSQSIQTYATTTAPDLPLNEAERYALGVWSLVTLILSGSGNSLVLIAIVHRKFKGDFTSRWLIANIAVSDIFYILTGVLTSMVSNFANTWLFGQFLCVATSNFANWFAIVHMIMLTILSLNKWLRCQFPLRSLYTKLSRRSGVFVTLFVWTLSLVPTVEYYALDRGAYFDVSINR